MEGILECCKTFGFFSDEQIATVKQTIKDTETLRLMDYNNKQYDNLYCHLEFMSDEIRSMIVNSIESYLEFDMEYPKTYFCEYGKDMFDNDCYIDAGFILHEPIVRKYA